MKLPNAHRAEVDLRKLSEYCLSETHPVGKHKATVFRSALGLTEADAERLKEWLQRAVQSDAGILVRIDEFGERFRVDFEAPAEDGEATIRSVWIVRSGEDFPRLTSCYVLPR